jgi:hypothetical protein
MRLKNFLHFCLLGALLVTAPWSCTKAGDEGNDDTSVERPQNPSQPEDEPDEPVIPDTIKVFSVSPKSLLEVPGFNAPDQTIVLTTEAEWTVSTPEWVSVKPFSGKGTTELTVTFFPNIKRDETTPAREGYVLFEAVGVADKDGFVVVKNLKLPVSQLGYTYDGSQFVLSSDPQKISDVAAQSPKEQSLALTTQTRWTLTTPDWVTAEPLSGKGDATIKLTFAENYKEKESTAARSGELVFKGMDPNFDDTTAVATLKVPVNQLGNTYTKPTYTLTVSPSQIENIAAKTPAESSLTVTTGAAWTVATPAWVSANPTSGKGNAMVKLTFSANYKETETTQARSAKVLFKATDPENSADTTTLARAEVSVSQLGNTYTPPVTTTGINSLADFKEFRDLVNAGSDYSKFCNSEGAVVLNVDLDFSGESNWTPIGYASAPLTSNVPAISGNAFTGRFSGNGHKLKNLKLVANGTVAGMPFGLFGTLGTGAIVENFILENSCSLTVTSSVSLSCGVVAGLVYDATVRDITSYAPITFKGGSVGTPMHTAIVGMLYSDAVGTTVDSVHNNGEIIAQNPAGTTENGGNAHHVAGIVGYAHASTNTAAKGNTISNCSNYGNMTSATARTSGVLAAGQSSTYLVNCENRGHQTNNFVTVGGARIGGVVCYLAGKSKMSGCINYGNVISKTSARVGGLVSLPASSTFEYCENYGTIQTDDTNRGLFFGYSGTVSSWSNCKASGKVGSYNNGSPVYDTYAESVKTTYLGKQGTNKSTFLNITYDVLFGDEEVDLDPSFDVAADYRILFIGNSFTQDAVAHLPGLVKAAGLKKVQMVHMYYGGRTIPEYNDGWLATDYHCYVCNPGADSWTDVTGKSLQVVAASVKWDVVTLQEHTGRSLAWGWTAAEKQAIDELISKVKGVQGNHVPKFHYIMSQAYENLSKAQSGAKPFTTQLGMYDLIVAQAKKAVSECAFDGVIATGTMLQNLRTSSLNKNNGMGLTRDGYHMDYGISRYGAGCAVFESIITPKFNVKLDKNTYRYSKSDTSTSAYSTPVTDSNAPIALKAARAAIAKPFEITDMSIASESVPDGGIGDVEYEEGSKE